MRSDHSNTPRVRRKPVFRRRRCVYRPEKSLHLKRVNYERTNCVKGQKRTKRQETEVRSCLEKTSCQRVHPWGSKHDGTGSESYDYDSRGNIVDGMNHLLSIVYNEENRLEQVEITSTQKAYYQYDHDGQRVRKVITNTSAAISQVRKYVGNWEAYQKIDTATNTVVLKRETLHVEDDHKRIALIDTPTVDTLSTGEAQILRYQHSNNINTASLELDENAAVITYEEFYPYGNTSFQGGRSVAECSLKRYRYTGKERDEETGLNYHGARYYAPWLARWTATEPRNSELFHFLNTKENKEKDEGAEQHFIELTAASYEYCYANPTRFIDPTGEIPLLPFWVDKNGNLVIFWLAEVKITAPRKGSKENPYKLKEFIVHGQRKRKDGEYTKLEISNYLVGAGSGAQGVTQGILDIEKELLKNLKIVKGIKGVGIGLNFLGGLLILEDIREKREFKFSHAVNLVVTGASFIPVFGWVIGLGWLLGELITKNVTGKSISEHIDENTNNGQPIAHW